MSDLYDVRVTLDAREGADQIAPVLLDAFCDRETATVAHPTSLQSGEESVTVNFHDLSSQMPIPGSAHQPPRAEEPSEAAGREAIAQLENVASDVLVPALRALVAVIAARGRAGLAPRQRVTIEVTPARPHTQDELRHS
jgi:hypothetical protein